MSIPELVARTALDRQLLCKATVDEETDLAYPFANGGEAFSTSRSTDCREEANGPLAPDGLPVVRQLPADGVRRGLHRTAARATARRSTR